MAFIIVDAGHGLHTSGKRCMKKLDPKETREWFLNNRIAVELVKILKNAGHQVLRVDDTDGSTDVSLYNRVKKANNKDADFYISIHHNAGIGGGTGGGTEVYVSNGCSNKSKQAQNAIYKHAIAEGKLKGNRSDGTRSANYYVLRKTTMPACLIECGFMDSKTDIKYILDPEWAKDIARGIAKGICEVYGGKVADEAEFVKKSVKKDNSFLVRVTAKSLNIRDGAGTDNEVIGTITDKGTYTIISTEKVGGTTWGKLKSSTAKEPKWISLHEKYVDRV